VRALAFVWRQQDLGFLRMRLAGAEELLESRLKVSEALEFNKRILETSSVGILTYDETGQCIFANEAAAEIAGTNVESLLSQNFHQIQPWKKSGMYEAALQALNTGIEQHTEVHVVTTFGKYVWLSLKFSSFYSKGKKQLLVFTSDITERKLAEEQIRRSLVEKEVMLKEIHHRVKNNMQVIFSLLNLQADTIADSTIRTLFEESRNRVSAMALIHEKLYQTEDLARIDFKEYLKILAQGIADTYQRHDVHLSVDMEHITLNVNTGIPCGLIVNELITNSFKHAFPKGRKGLIRVGMNKNSEGNYVLIVEDNGIGFEAEQDFRKTSSLGLRLVGVLTGQIRGTIALSRSDGTRFCITFPATT
jgi:PAS domain S-box-containing protein